MAAKRALLVGLTGVDPKQYDGWDGKSGCWGCETDVNNVSTILKKNEFEIKTLLTSAATHEAVLFALEREASRAQPGDFLVFYYSGHGDQVRDVNGDEDDGSDETLVLYDKQLIDDELNERVWLQLAEGVYVVMISDSCHSATNMRAMLNRDGRPARASLPLRSVMSPRDSATMRAEMIHLAGCRDEGTSMGDQAGGAFTQEMCRILNAATFHGTYYSLLKSIAIAPQVARGQSPQYNEYGSVSNPFRHSVPFTLPGPSAMRDFDPDVRRSRSSDAPTVSIVINVGESAAADISTSRSGHSRGGHSRNGPSGGGHSPRSQTRGGHSP